VGVDHPLDRGAGQVKDDSPKTAAKTIRYEDEIERLTQNVKLAEQSLACTMAAYGGLSWNNDRERLHLLQCFEGIAAALSMKAAFMLLVSSQIRNSQ